MIFDFPAIPDLSSHLNKIQYFTNLNLAAMNGDDSPSHMQPMVLEYESQHLPHFYDPVL